MSHKILIRGINFSEKQPTHLMNSSKSFGEICAPKGYTFWDSIAVPSGGPPHSGIRYMLGGGIANSGFRAVSHEAVLHMKGLIQMTCGSWKIADNLNACALPAQVADGWKTALPVGVDYTPVLYCGSQLVSGMNHMLICKRTYVVLHPDETAELVKVVLHQPLPGDPNDRWYIISQETLLENSITSTPAQSGNPYVEYASLVELSQAAGFEVVVPAVLPLSSVQHFYLIAGKIANICYVNGITYRMSNSANEDISGDYKEYSRVDTYDLGQYHVKARGNGSLVYSVIWWSNGVSYSLSIPHGVGTDSVKQMIASLNSGSVFARKEYAHIFEAEYAVGFGVLAPSGKAAAELEHIYVISGQVVELDYKDGPCLRQAKGMVDISGHYETYPENITFTVGSYHVAAKGENGKYSVILWHDDNKSYSLVAPNAMDQAQIKSYIESLSMAN